MKNPGMFSGSGDRAATLPMHKRMAMTPQPMNTAVKIPGLTTPAVKGR